MSKNVRNSNNSMRSWSGIGGPTDLKIMSHPSEIIRNRFSNFAMFCPWDYYAGTRFNLKHGDWFTLQLE
jgi:hypothetical protein